MIKFEFNALKQYEALTEKKPEFPLNIDIKLWTRTFSTIHTHNFWEIMVVLDGELINELDGTATIMAKGDICLIEKDNIHWIKPQNTTPVKYINLSIQTEYLVALANLVSLDFFENLKANQYKKISWQELEKIEKLMLVAISTPSFQIKKKQSLLQIVATKLLTEFALKEKEYSKSTINEILNLMAKPENMSKSTKEIAGLVGYSFEHIIRLFKKHNLNSPNQVFTKIKLDYSAQLLTTTDFSIDYISECIGISDPSYFNKLFKKNFGMSPKDFKKKNH